MDADSYNKRLTHWEMEDRYISEGWYAYYTGLTALQSPYKIFSNEYRLWSTGFNQAIIFEA
jgi:hypothetical protein